MLVKRRSLSTCSGLRGDRTETDSIIDAKYVRDYRTTSHKSGVCQTAAHDRDANVHNVSLRKGRTHLYRTHGTVCGNKRGVYIRGDYTGRPTSEQISRAQGQSAFRRTHNEGSGLIIGSDLTEGVEEGIRRAEDWKTRTVDYQHLRREDSKSRTLADLTVLGSWAVGEECTQSILCGGVSIVEFVRVCGTAVCISVQLCQSRTEAIENGDVCRKTSEETFGVERHFMEEEL
ncbi:hypothetical protein Tco_1484564 [Tanacetum coccineum]